MTQEQMISYQKEMANCMSFASIDDVRRLPSINGRLVNEISQTRMEWEEQNIHAIRLNSNGFLKDQFSHSASYGGRYLTRTEMNALLHVAINKSKIALAGLSRKSSIVKNIRSVNGLTFQGAICREEDGTRSICKSANPVIWETFKGCSSCFHLYDTNLETFNWLHDTIDKIPVYGVTNQKILVGKVRLYNGITRVGSYIDVAGKELSPQTGRIPFQVWKLFHVADVSKYASLSIRLSPYSDIYDTDGHYRQSFEAATFVSIPYDSVPTQYNRNVVHQKIREFPSKTLDYFLYLEYTNASPVLVYEDGATLPTTEIKLSGNNVSYPNVTSRMRMCPWGIELNKK